MGSQKLIFFSVVEYIYRYYSTNDDRKYQFYTRQIKLHLFKVIYSVDDFDDYTKIYFG